MSNRLWRVEVYGFAEVYIPAETKAKAMYQAFKKFIDANYRWDFHKFLINTTVTSTAKTQEN